jgi:hypothetical protein
MLPEQMGSGGFFEKIARKHLRKIFIISSLSPGI